MTQKSKWKNLKSVLAKLEADLTLSHVIGAFFGIVGLLLVAQSYFGTPGIREGIEVNRVFGALMILFSCLMVSLPTDK